ncbi:MAG: hypothetical protein R3Y04_09045 [Rikenellaceae bacterium]
MKHLRLFFLFTVIFIGSSSAIAQKTRRVINPPVKALSSATFNINKVELSDTATVLTIDVN